LYRIVRVAVCESRPRNEEAIRDLWFHRLIWPWAVWLLTDPQIKVMLVTTVETHLDSHALKYNQIILVVKLFI
jgi:hypothetical protein